MSINEKIKKATRLLTLPKDWRAPGNMEFDELLSIALVHPEIAEKEIYERFKHWYREFRIVQTTKLIIAALSLAVILFWCIQAHNIIAICVIVAFISPIMASVFLMKRRATAIKDKLLHCYSWLINEIIRPDKTNHNIPLSLEKAFIKASSQAKRREHIEQKKFVRIIKGFGYSLTTLNN